MIFLAEDDDATRDAICMMLECEALSVRGFPSCEALCAAVDPAAADCLILDVHMDGATGLELLERLAADGIVPPVILITGRPTTDVLDRAAAAGAFAVLDKPFRGEDLVEMVVRAIASGDPSADPIL